MSNRRKTRIERLEQTVKNNPRRRYQAKTELQQISESVIDKVMADIQKKKETK